MEKKYIKRINGEQRKRSDRQLITTVNKETYPNNRMTEILMLKKYTKGLSNSLVRN